ncbi:MAG: hypothetical protein C4K47_04495 [Candidatus Thorarchaeota archaeon]|nr:MAG: hypothetical protein C4K47_04495 [Candidatus Thorarchaeota archaeon]
MYDVAIVGAGPAGSTAARYLAKLGFSTCLIDKCGFPRDKPCGGGFSPQLLEEFSYLKAREDSFAVSISKTGVLHPRGRLVALRGRADMMMTLREQFDNALLNEAIDCGAQPLTSCRVKSVQASKEKVLVHTSEGKVVETKAIVGADGVNSTVARETGLNVRWPAGSLTACKVMEIPVNESRITDYYGEDREYHFFANFGGRPGYGWLFPKINTVNVGLGIVTNAGGSLVEQFSLFVKMLQHEGLLIPSAEPDCARGALVPTAGPVPCTIVDRALLVGDSAGMVSPLTGGGIAYAMRAGKFAAIALAGALEREDLRAKSLLTYQRAWQHSFGRDMKRQLIAQKLFTSSIANTLFEIGHRDLKLQDMVAHLMASGSTSAATAARIVGRVVWVCLREVLH